MSSSTPLGVPTKIIPSSKVTHKHKMGSLIVSSKKDTEKIKKNDELNLIERRSLRLRTQTLLDPTEEKIKLIQSKSGEQKEQTKPLEHQEKQLKRKVSTPKEENFNKKPKLAMNKISAALNERNKTCEDIKIHKSSAKKNRPQIFWENKLTGARRVSKRLSKLEMKNKQIKSQLVPEKQKIRTTQYIPIRNESTYEKSTFRKQIFSGKTAHKRVKSNKFLLISKVIKDEDIVEDKDIVISLKRLDQHNQPSENQCISYLKETEIPIDEGCLVPDEKAVFENVEACQELNEETETSTVLLSDNEEHFLTGKEVIQVTVNGEEGGIVKNENEQDLDATQSTVVAEVLDLEKSTDENWCDPELNEIVICSEIHCPPSNIEINDEITNTNSENKNLELLKKSTCSANADKNEDKIYKEKVESIADQALVEKLAEQMNQ